MDTGSARGWGCRSLRLEELTLSTNSDVWPERRSGTVCKTVGSAYVGSNPTSPISLNWAAIPRFPPVCGAQRGRGGAPDWIDLLRFTTEQLPDGRLSA